MSAISVIVPLYNKRKYLAAMLDSVLQQSFSDFEIVVVDDGSTDGSGQIADAYAAQDPRVQVYHIDNGGVSHARNVGLDIAKGEYITFMDADDTVSADYLENLYRCITENDVDIVISGVTKVWENSDKIEYIIPPCVGEKMISEVLAGFARVQQMTGIYGYCVAKVFSKTFLGNIRFDERLCLSEDFDFYLKLYQKVTSIYFSNIAGYHYLQETDNSPLQVKDDEIDYLKQLAIQLRFADFLKRLGFYKGENREIVERNIRNYMYLTLHHATKESFDEKFSLLYSTCQNTDIALEEQGFRQDVILCLLKNNKRHILWFLIHSYREAKKFIRR